MVLPVLDVFSNNNFVTNRTGNFSRPILNNMPNITSKLPKSFGSFNSLYQRFWRDFRQSPELVAVINIIVTDILGDRPNFVGLDDKPLGRNKMMQAQRFWRENRVKETLSSILFDMLITGDGYGWIGKLPKNQQVRIVKEFVRDMKLKYKLKELQEKRLLIKATQDEDLKLPKKFDYVPSSTMQINNDNFEILNYVQHAQGLTSEFTPEEIIHFRWMTVDGKVEGFSPMESLIRETSLLYFVKGNMLAYMENGGNPAPM